jgi:DeoR/GlpR family transcriptional regulator of sugar metabolism
MLLWNKITHNRAQMDINEALLKAERQNRIRKIVEQKGRVTVAELSEDFDVSEATIRRDLEKLDGQGWIQRTHGGAVRVERASREPPILQRIDERRDEKQRIGQAAAALVKDGETIFFGSGTTVLEIAHHLPEGFSLTVITNSLLVVNELAERSDIEMIVIGGMLRQSELSMVGHIAEQAVREFRADRVFMGMRAIDARHGFTNDYLPETMTDRAILNISPKVVVVADHRKFGRVSSVLVGPVTVAHMIITGKATSQECVRELQEKGIDVVQV